MTIAVVIVIFVALLITNLAAYTAFQHDIEVCGGGDITVTVKDYAGGEEINLTSAENKELISEFKRLNFGGVSIFENYIFGGEEAYSVNFSSSDGSMYLIFV